MKLFTHTMKEVFFRVSTRYKIGGSISNSGDWISARDAIESAIYKSESNPELDVSIVVFDRATGHPAYELKITAL